MNVALAILYLSGHGLHIRCVGYDASQSLAFSLIQVQLLLIGKVTRAVIWAYTLDAFIALLTDFTNIQGFFFSAESRK